MSPLHVYHSQLDAFSIEREIQRYCVALSIDWNNPNDVRELAIKVHNFTPQIANQLMHSNNRDQISLANLCALIQIMFKTMEKSALCGVHAHGGEAWKSIAKELYKLNEN